MKASKKAYDIIKTGESLRLKTYVCPAGVLTIGYGHTGVGVVSGLVISQSHADELLVQDVSSAESTVSRLVKVALTQNQFDALVSLTFNIGSGNFSTSTLLRKLNAGDYAGAAAEFPRWNKAKGQVLSGLVTRRAEERLLFENKS